MRERKYLFPHVIEMNYQAGRRLGVNVYLIDGGSEFLLIDIGFLEAVDEIVELIRQMDFNLSTCKMVIATHADADHIQGIARARELLKTKVAAHPESVAPIESGDEIMTYATIKAQGLEIPMPRCKIDVELNEGDTIRVGQRGPAGLAHAWPHRRPTQFQVGQPPLQRRHIYKDSCVGVIDAHQRLEYPRLPRVAEADHARRQ